RLGATPRPRRAGAGPAVCEEQTAEDRRGRAAAAGYGGRAPAPDRQLRFRIPPSGPQAPGGRAAAGAGGAHAHLVLAPGMTGTARLEVVAGTGLSILRGRVGPAQEAVLVLRLRLLGTASVLREQR